MPGLVATPVVAYATSTSWIAAPAVADGSFAWLEVDRGDGSTKTVVGFRGDRLIVKRGGAADKIVDAPCEAKPCDVVRGPVVGGTGFFAYSVAFPATAAYVASVSSTGASTIVEEVADPAAVTTPWLVAATMGGVAWVQDNGIRLAPSVGGTAVILVAPDATGGEVTALSASASGIAWVVTTADGGSAVLVRAADGTVGVRAQESASAVRYGALALADDGTVVAVRRSVVKGRQRIDVVALAPDGTRKNLLRSVPLSRSAAIEPMRPSVTGTLVAARLREGDGGDTDAIWVLDRATGRSQRVTAISRSAGRLSDPSFGGRRVVWSSTELRRGTLKRARVLSSAVRGAR